MSHSTALSLLINILSYAARENNARNAVSRYKSQLHRIHETLIIIKNNGWAVAIQIENARQSVSLASYNGPS